jgi:hypothetical protein
MGKNLFIVGLDPFHLHQLKALARSSEYHFISLISYEEIKCGLHFPVRELLDQAPRLLADYPGSVDAIVGYWDFPVSTVLPILQKRQGLRGPSLEAVLMCEHKYWSRMKQQEVIPESIPAFQKINPFDPDTVLDWKLDYPFWLKPVKSVLSYLGFMIRDEREFKKALAEIRKGIARYAVPFNYILNRIEIPAEIRSVDGYHCIAESLISEGCQCTLEGYAQDGTVYVYGIIDSVREGEHQSSFSRYQYPSILPQQVQQRMIITTQKLIKHLDYRDAPFNIEFFWDERSDHIRLLEINTRISKSHGPLFKMVDGEYHHDVMIDVALGRSPRFPHRQGRYTTAAKFMVRCYRDGKVLGTPVPRDVQRVRKRFEGAEIQINVIPGMRLSELRDQDSYSYEIADLFIGADSEEELLANYHEAMAMLPFHIVYDKEGI